MQGLSYVLGLDLGTSALKGLLVNKVGEVLKTITVDYPLITPERGYSEQDPNQWVSASKEVMKQLVQTFPGAVSEIEGISFSGQMHSLVLIDDEGNSLRNAILWNDVRTTKQCEVITEKLGSDLINITKNKALEGFTLPKILWVQEHEPEIWAQATTMLLPKDYLRYKLTGKLNMDYSDAAGTLLLDVSKNEWSKQIQDLFGIEASFCPPLVNSTDRVGYLDKKIAEEIGFENEIPVFAGGADNACGAIGAGIVNLEQAMASIGTSGVFLTYEEDGGKDYDGKLHFFNHVVPGNYYSMGVTLAAGSSLSWFKNNFAPNESFEDMLKDIGSISPGSEGLLFTPYLSGERTPYTDSNIRGSFIGMDISHTRDHFARAVLEGVTFSLRDSQEIMRKNFTKEFKKIISVGGGAKNKDWLQMQADIFNTPITVLSTEQGPGMGAAMIAAVGTGWFSDFQKCTDIFVNHQLEVQPISVNVAKYEEVYQVYREIYPTVKDLSHKTVEI